MQPDTPPPAPVPWAWLTVLPGCALVLERAGPGGRGPLVLGGGVGARPRVQSQLRVRDLGQDLARGVARRASSLEEVHKLRDT